MFNTEIQLSIAKIIQLGDWPPKVATISAEKERCGICKLEESKENERKGWAAGSKSLAAHSGQDKIWRQDIGAGKLTLNQVLMSVHCSRATYSGFKSNTVATMNMFEALLARQKQEAEDKIYFSSATSLSGIISKHSSSQYHFKAQDYLKVMDSPRSLQIFEYSDRTIPLHQSIDKDHLSGAYKWYIQGI